MLTAYHARLERGIQCLLYPGVACMLAGQLWVSVLGDMLLWLGLFLLGMTTGLLHARAVAYSLFPTP